MATVRPYEQQVTPEAMPTPFQAPDVSPQAAGAGVGQALEQGAQALDESYKQERAKADAAAALGGLGQANGVFNSEVLDAQNGYLSLKGEAALAARDKTLQRVGERISQIRAGLANDNQRRAFDAHAVGILQQANHVVQSHFGQQRDQFYHEQFLGQVGALDQRIQAVAGDPTLTGSAMDDVRTAARVRAAQLGLSGHDAENFALPYVQKAAIDGMEAATSTGNADIAKAALDKLGPSLLNHQHHYAALVTAMQQKQQVGAYARAAVAGAVTMVVIPGGQRVPRLDATKLSATLADVAPDDPLAAEKVKAVETQQAVLNKVWDQTVAQRVASAETAGTDPQSGEFSMGRVSTADRLWLQQNAPAELIKLRTLDARAQRLDSREIKLASQTNYTTVLADMIDPDRRQAVYGSMSIEQFSKALNDEEQFPGGFLPADKAKALGEFKRIKAAAGKPTEAIPAVVNDVLKEVFPAAPNNRIKYAGPLKDAVQGWVDQQRAANAGKVPDQDKIRAFAAQQMVRSVPSGHWYSGDQRPIDIRMATPATSAAPPPAKAIRSYRYSKDRTQRAPVFTDGSVGQLEAVTQ